MQHDIEPFLFGGCLCDQSFSEHNELNIKEHPENFKTISVFKKKAMQILNDCITQDPSGFILDVSGTEEDVLYRWYMQEIISMRKHVSEILREKTILIWHNEIEINVLQKITEKLEETDTELINIGYRLGLDISRIIRSCVRCI